MDNQDWVEEFSNNLRAVMREEKITQRQLANKSGMSQADISRYINGKQIPSCRAIINLAYALHCSTDDLIDFGEPIK